MAHKDRDHNADSTTDPRLTNTARTRTNRPYSSPSVPTANSLLGMTTSTPVASHNTPPGSAASSVRTRRPPNAVVTGTGGTAGTAAGGAIRSSTTRPKTAYQAVTWKENLDAFNRRLRRGSLSLDAATQEEEFASLTMARAKAQPQYHQDPSLGTHTHAHIHTHICQLDLAKSGQSYFFGEVPISPDTDLVTMFR